MDKPARELKIWNHYLGTRGSVCRSAVILFWGTCNIQNFPLMLPTKFQLIWPNGFREDFFLIGQSQTRTANGTILVVWSARKIKILYRISHTSFLQSNNSLCLLVFLISALSARCQLKKYMSAVKFKTRDDFHFLIVNFALYVAAPAYVVYISQLIWYSRTCGYFHHSYS